MASISGRVNFSIWLRCIALLSAQLRGKSETYMTAGLGGMGEIVNLRTVRKRTRRQQETDAAAMRRMQHGVPKAEQSLSRAQQKLARRKHDQHRIESGEAK